MRNEKRRERERAGALMQSGERRGAVNIGSCMQW